MHLRCFFFSKNSRNLRKSVHPLPPPPVFIGGSKYPQEKSMSMSFQYYCDTQTFYQHPVEKSDFNFLLLLVAGLDKLKQIFHSHFQFCSQRDIFATKVLCFNVSRFCFSTLDNTFFAYRQISTNEGYRPKQTKVDVLPHLNAAQLLSKQTAVSSQHQLGETLSSFHVSSPSLFLRISLSSPSSSSLLSILLRGVIPTRSKL